MACACAGSHAILLDMDSGAVDLAEKLSLFSEHWSPKIIASLNDYEIKPVPWPKEDD